MQMQQYRTTNGKERQKHLAPLSTSGIKSNWGLQKRHSQKKFKLENLLKNSTKIYFKILPQPGTTMKSAQTNRKTKTFLVSPTVSVGDTRCCEELTNDGLINSIQEKTHT